jgi:hypothetical protein
LRKSLHDAYAAGERAITAMRGEPTRPARRVAESTRRYRAR